MNLQNTKNNIKFSLKKYRRLYAFIRKLYYFQKFRLPIHRSITKILESYSANNNKIYFIQIGANNGKDEFALLRRKYKWSGILIEPQKNIFDELKKNNENDHELIFENVAISDKSEIRKFYRLTLTSGWFSAISSFDKNNIINQKGWIEQCAKYEGIMLPNDIEDIIIAEDVICICFNDLVTKHKIDKIDILIIDTEGYDFEIIKTIDFNFITPNIIVFEYMNLNRASYRKCINLLRKNQYELFSDEMDIIAVQKKININRILNDVSN